MKALMSLIALKESQAAGGWTINKGYMEPWGNAAASIRYETFEGRRHLVAPVTLLVEGVHIGMGGRALYYPAQELARHPASWNGRPVPIFHPTIKGEDGNVIPVSANSPEVLQRERAGYLFNAWYDEAKRALRAEIWLEEEKARRKAPSLVSALERGERIEVSTGLWGDIEEVGGVWNGETYEAVFRNYLPDHLALLPGGEGACNLKDGCGVFNQDGQSGPSMAALDEHKEGGSMEPKAMMGKMKQIMGRMKSMMDEVMKEMEEMPEDMAKEMPDKDMPPEMKKDGMMAKGSPDAAALTTEINQKTEEAPPVEEKKENAPVVNCEVCTKKQAEVPKANTAEEFAALAPPEIRSTLLRGVRMERERKDALVSGLMANERNRFSKEALAGKDVDELEALAALAGEPYRPQETAFNYALQGGGYQANREGYDDVPPSFDD